LPASRQQQPERPPSSESPWFWASLFLTFALLALVLAGPKFRWRQPQIERQFQARERSGLSVSARGGPGPLSTTGKPMLSLRPLFVVLELLLAVTWSVWLWQRFGPIRPERAIPQRPQSP
jgi:hypothetical protein